MHRLPTWRDTITYELVGLSTTGCVGFSITGRKHMQIVSDLVQQDHVGFSITE